MRRRMHDPGGRTPAARKGWLGRGLALVLGVAAGTLLFPRPARGRPEEGDGREKRVRA